LGEDARLVKFGAGCVGTPKAERVPEVFVRMKGGVLKMAGPATLEEPSGNDKHLAFDQAVRVSCMVAKLLLLTAMIPNV
jgi:hypothetical protein